MSDGRAVMHIARMQRQAHQRRVPLHHGGPAHRLARQRPAPCIAAAVDQAGRIDRLVAIATPFGGSRYAKYMLDPTLRAFVPTHKTLRMLGANAEVNARIVSVYGEFDPNIPEGSELQGAANLSFAVRGHFRLLCDERVLAAVQAALRE